MRGAMLKPMLKKAALVVAGVLVVGQAVRPDRTNPPIDPAKTLAASGEAPAAVMASLDRGCRDCHSSETDWPWYTNVAPISWWIAHHVNDGRREVSFSNWADLDPRRKAKKLGDICEQVERKEMPMTSYLLIHREAELSDAERQAICDWTKAERATLPSMPEGPEGGREGRRRRRD
jgi:hypothetical protein